LNVEFDGENLLIKVNQGVTTLDIQTDIYSDWKEWFNQSDNSKFLPAIRTIGGDPTVGEKVVAPYFFLMNGWKIKPASWNHTLNLIGNLFVDEPETYGSNVNVPPDGYYTVLINMSTTSDASKIISGSGVTQQDKLDIAGLIEQSEVLAKEASVAKEVTLANKASQTSVDNIKTETDKIPDIKTEVDKIETIKQTGEETQGQLTDVQVQTTNIEQHHILRRKIVGDYLYYYDGETPVAKYKLVKDADGRIIERIPEPV
jgi:hypothetical protein